MTEGTVRVRSPMKAKGEADRAWRAAALLLSCALFIVLLVPPLSTLARRYEYLEALQYSAFLVLCPSLLVYGAPWRALRLSAGSSADIGRQSASEVSGATVLDRRALRRRREKGSRPVVAIGVLFVVAASFWRIPLTVNALHSHRWLVFVEALSLLVVGVFLWTELIESEPLRPRLARPFRIALAAVSMWSIWVLAYFVALSHSAWYRSYPHHAGTGISLSADQQLSAGVLWFASGTAFISLIFFNLFRWLKEEEDPDDALGALVRLERIRMGSAPAVGSAAALEGKGVS